MIATIIVGNGIGMALDDNYFKLTTGINEVAQDPSKDVKKMIRLGLGGVPMSENDLEDHHSVLSACNTLMNYQNKNLTWLSPDGKEFPDRYQDFIYQVARYFFKYDKELPDKFVNNLCCFINRLERCHIATLNYDKLLYDALIKKDILRGYQDGGLVDGIHNMKSGFKIDNLLQTQCNFGWYLHLHGSPIFRTTKDNEITKCHRDFLPENAITEEGVHKHIVLAHTKDKPAVISKSKLLDAYFDFFIRALAESDEVYLFGYSGLDEHVNDEVKKWLATNDNKIRKIRIIEWEDENNGNRKKFWSGKISPEGFDHERMNLIGLPNIFHYPFSEI